MKTSSPRSELWEKPNSNEDLKILLCSYDTKVYYYQYYNIFIFVAAGHCSPATKMSIVSVNEANIILWTLAKLLQTFEQCQY